MPPPPPTPPPASRPPTPPMPPSPPPPTALAAGSDLHEAGDAQIPPPPSPPTGHLAAVECLFETLRCLPGGCERGASTCISCSWFIMEDDELSASVPLL
ncbi:hypothetical protein DAI22_09g151050 [Oryza sativa Japonica Group]|nr:hypothetical protein DAI22_09g151050 [Oryza sativa Japonica Group]